MSSFTPLINQSNELLERKHYHIETIDYLLVSPADQKLFHISNKQILKNYSVSTSRFGLGNLMDSIDWFTSHDIRKNSDINNICFILISFD